MSVIKKENALIFLAPMAGVADRPFREICREYGAEYTTSEMVSVKGLYYKSDKTESLMKRAKNEQTNYAVQIFGSEPEIFRKMAPMVEGYADSIDINMGCPAPKIVNNGDGSALMKNPQLMGEIVRATVESVNVPVTVKMRLGWDEKHITVLEAAKLCEENGASMLTIHGRVRKQFYSGKADLSMIKRVKEQAKIPIIGNGDIFCAEDAQNMLRETCVDGIAIGRGSQGNPFIFREITSLLKTGKICPRPELSERLETALRHLSLMIEETDELHAVREARKHMAWYLKGIKCGGIAKAEIFKAEKYDDIKHIFDKLLQGGIELWQNSDIQHVEHVQEQ